MKKRNQNNNLKYPFHNILPRIYSMYLLKIDEIISYQKTPSQISSTHSQEVGAAQKHSPPEF